MYSVVAARVTTRRRTARTQHDPTTNSCKMDHADKTDTKHDRTKADPQDRHGQRGQDRDNRPDRHDDVGRSTKDATTTKTSNTAACPRSLLAWSRHRLGHLGLPGSVRLVDPPRPKKEHQQYQPGRKDRQRNIDRATKTHKTDMTNKGATENTDEPVPTTYSKNRKTRTTNTIKNMCG